MQWISRNVNNFLKIQGILGNAENLSWWGEVDFKSYQGLFTLFSLTRTFEREGP